MQKDNVPPIRADEREPYTTPVPDEWVTYVDADGVTQRIGIIYTPGVTWQEVIGPIIRDLFMEE